MEGVEEIKQEKTSQPRNIFVENTPKWGTVSMLFYIPHSESMAGLTQTDTYKHAEGVKCQI